MQRSTLDPAKSGLPRPRRGRRRAFVVAGTLAVAAVTSVVTSVGAQAASTTATGGTLDWGLRSSFRSYIVGPIAHGTVTPTAGATQNANNGTFVFSAGTGTVDPTAGTASLSYSGTVSFTGHDEGSGPQLAMTLSNPKVDVSGTSATLTAAVTSKSLSSGAVVDYGTIPFATFTVASGSLNPDASGNLTLTTGQGKLTSQGVPAFANFYLPPDNDYTDPLTLTAKVATGGTTTPPASTPTVTVSRTTVDPAGETVTVTGTGFDPALVTATRPPLTGKSGGVYVAFGTFLENWKPSAGAAAAARKTSSVKWAVLEADRATVGTGASVTLNPDGTFTATLDVKEGFDGALADGRYGIYTYPGGGAVNASFETYTPITFATTPTTPTGVSASQTITASIADTGGLTMSVDGNQVTLPVAELSTDGTKLTSSGALNPVRVTDLRSANPGWSVSGQLTDFTAAGSTLDGKYLGWTPSVTSSATGQTVTAGAAVAAGTGLKSSGVLGTAAAGAGRGTAVLGAGLSLQAPSETVPGTYSATLTLTAI